MRRFASGLAFVIGIVVICQVKSAEFEPAASSQSVDDPVLTAKRFKIPAGFKVDLFAAEPLLANPVGFCADEKGRFFVAETYRHSAVGTAYRFFEGVLDIRSHMSWLEEDLACRTVQDRIAMLRKNMGPAIEKMERMSERVRLIEDLDGDGKADRATTFAEGFTQIEDGIGASVLARQGKVWFTCIPELWELEDRDKDGKAEVKESVFGGFGVHIAFLGHDLHGLRLGPDGRLYFSIGDRGLNVRTREGKQLSYPDEGTVLRCELDGSHLEVFARGLRNPQDLTFDEFGNLFTGDNNSDGGDRARWVYLVEGGDSGWRVGYQHLSVPPRRGPWNAERLWYPAFDGQAAYIVPPVANLGYGPSGCVYYPGTGLPDRYQGHFWLCDFRGGASSGIHTFTLKHKGASFELGAYEQFVWEALPTDVDFGLDGGLYFTDWVQGWNKTGKGRIYRVFDPAIAESPAVARTKRWLSEGFKHRPNSELAVLLGAEDMRVRQEAQFELAGRARSDASALNVLAEIARSGANEHARYHAIWGLGQCGRHQDQAKSLQTQIGKVLTGLLRDSEDEIRAQAARTIGDNLNAEADAELRALLNDASPRVRFLAAVSLGKTRTPGPENSRALFALLRDNADKDAYLRHAAVQGLHGNATTALLNEGARDASRSVRLGTLLVMRRQANSQVAQFLKDSDPDLVVEAARAIHDLPMAGALPALAGLIEQPTLRAFGTTPPSSDPLPLLRKISDIPIGQGKTNTAVEAAVSSVAPDTASTSPQVQLFTRVLAANYRLGEASNASALTKFASLENAPAGLRAEALRALANWGNPSKLDRITGLWQPGKTRNPVDAARAFAARAERIWRMTNANVLQAAFDLVTGLQIQSATSAVRNIFLNDKHSAEVRASALRTSAKLRDPGLQKLLDAAKNSPDELVRKAATQARASIDPESTLAEIKQTLNNGSRAEKQNAFSILAALPNQGADEVIANWMQRLISGQLDRALQLDLLDAAAKRTSSGVLEKVQAFESTRTKDPLGNFQECLEGGSASEGKRIFYERAEVFCSRCHQINGEGGEAGPKLTGIGSRKDRAYLLESIIFPNNQIALGWENVVVAKHGGRSVIGLVKRETTDVLEINSPEDGDVTIPKAEIKSRERALSAMPEEFRHILNKQDLRNLVQFLAEQK